MARHGCSARLRSVPVGCSAEQGSSGVLAQRVQNVLMARQPCGFALPAQQVNDALLSEPAAWRLAGSGVDAQRGAQRSHGGS